MANEHPRGEIVYANEGIQIVIGTVYDRTLPVHTTRIYNVKDIHQICFPHRCVGCLLLYEAESVIKLLEDIGQKLRIYNGSPLKFK
eukprot:scaffold406056_cov41-Prasinocladus_malaysianus.AAC.1